VGCSYTQNKYWLTARLLLLLVAVVAAIAAARLSRLKWMKPNLLFLQLNGVHCQLMRLDSPHCYSLACDCSAQVAPLS
jgi:hypothetical protein